MSDPLHVHTPENVAVSYDLAGVGSRFLAAFVDLCVQAVLLGVLWFALASAAGLVASAGLLRELASADLAGAAIWLAALFLLANFLLLWGYYAAFELLWNGQTPGKRLFQLRVMRESGYPVGPLDSLIRNLVRVIDFLPAFYGIGVLTMLIDSRSRRLGDLAAGTIVVRERSDLRVADLVPAADPPDDAAVFAVPNLDRLQEREQRVLREYLLRRDGLTAASRDAVAREVAAALSARLDAPRPTSDDEADAFLLSVAAAWRARQQPTPPGPSPPSEPPRGG
jgi:uncharacterized RDD family membrane protein YckC